MNLHVPLTLHLYQKHHEIGEEAAVRGQGRDGVEPQ